MLKLPDKLVQQIYQIKDLQQRAVLDVLRQRVGRDRAIGRSPLLHCIHDCRVFDPAVGQDTRPLANVSERELRTTIGKLREQGLPICSAAGATGGYYLASNAGELSEFLKHEIDSRIISLALTRRRMCAGGLAIFGGQAQLDYETQRAALDAEHHERMVAGDDRARRRKVEA